MNRRQFLQRAGRVSGGLLILRNARTAFAYRANERFNLAVIGMAGYGAQHGFAGALHTYKNVGYAFGCDVDRRKVQTVHDFWKQRAAQWSASSKEEERNAAVEIYQPLADKLPPLYSDFREMLEKEGRNI